MTTSEIERIIARIDEMDAKLEPIYETYKTTTTLGKWVKALLLFVSIVVGVIIGVKQLWK